MGSIGGYPICDPAAGAVVSIMVLKAAYDVGRKCVQDLTDTNSYGIVDDVKSLLQPLQVFILFPFSIFHFFFFLSFLKKLLIIKRTQLVKSKIFMMLELEIWVHISSLIFICE